MLPQAKDMVVNDSGTEGSGTGGGSMGGGGGGGGAGGPDGPFLPTPFALLTRPAPSSAQKRATASSPTLERAKEPSKTPTNGHSATYSTESTKQSPSQSAKTPRILNTAVGSGSTAAKTILPFTSTTATNGYPPHPQSASTALRVLSACLPKRSRLLRLALFKPVLMSQAMPVKLRR